MKTFSDFGIDAPSSYNSAGDGYTTCPKCSGSRRKSKVKCLSVNQTLQCWNCFHCGYSGSLKSGEERPSIRPKIIRKPSYTPSQLFSDEAIFFFMQRGIPLPLIMDEQITVADAYMPQEEDWVPCIQFPYVKNGSVANIKFRALGSKSFRQVADAEKIFFRQDRIAKDLTIITEGEFDALACVVAGFKSAISVPDGAPSPKAKDYTSKFGYLDQEPDPFADVEKIILAVDDDEPGRVLRDELARRLGRDRCYTVQWPAGCKDANDVLLNEGAETLRACLEAAREFPVQDVINVTDAAEFVSALYYGTRATGLSTGWSAIDQFYTVEAGQLTVVTGSAGSGKSEWIDALVMNLALLHGWRFVMCSPENAPVEEHIAKLLEKYIGKPFRVGPSNRMTPYEMAEGLEYLQPWISFILPQVTLSIEGVLERATSLVRRRGIQGLIIDPFNCFDHTRDRGQSETEYIGMILGRLKQWAQRWRAHVWLVAHPQKLYRRDDGTYPVPTPWDISGSAHFRNKADNCITVWRDEDSPNLPVQIHIQKVRFKYIGRIGMAELFWDRASGRYSEILNVYEEQQP